MILVTGGNQGSHIINKAVEEILSKLLKKAYVIHQTGDSKFRDFERLEEKQNGRYLVKKFIDQEMGVVLSSVDLVISRGGINTLTELAHLEKPALVIPVPYLYQDEQSRNAKYFADLGLVKILPQANLNGKTLMETVTQMLKDLDRFKKKANDAKEVIIPDAAKRLTLEILTATNQNNI